MKLLLPNTEDHIWIQLPFKVKAKDRCLTKREARRRAVAYRRDGKLARVVSLVEGWCVATHTPRRNKPRRCDLKI